MVNNTTCRGLPLASFRQAAASNQRWSFQACLCKLPRISFLTARVLSIPYYIPKRRTDRSSIARVM
jgi:hypothetical protein